MVFMDGTHNVLAQSLVLTCLVVRVNGAEGFVAAWMVHQSKTHETYEFFLRSIFGATRQWHPAYFVLDFEIAEKLAVMAVFPDCRISLCTFHLFQSVRRWLQENQIAEEAQQTIFHHVKLLQSATSRMEFDGQCLASLPILNKTCSLFYDYFWNNYIKPGQTRFPSELWSSYINLNFKNRTNNVIESKNHSIKTRIGEGLSELKFVVKAKEYSENQILLISSEHNKTWLQILNEPLEDMVSFQILINLLIFFLARPF